MTKRAVELLLSWASDQSPETQEKFVIFYEEQYDRFMSDESCGAPSSKFTIDMMERCIEEFETRAEILE
jgi:hypothetical protein